ncbi:SWIM zinc finger family protein, partial [Rariglobus hedericola]
MAVRPRAPHVRSVRTPEALASMAVWLESFDAATRQRGSELFKKGAVTNVWSEADHLVKAELTDDYRYTLTFFLTRGDWSSRCSCSTTARCKHSHAAGLAWIHNVESGARDGRDPGDAPIVPKTVAAPVTAASTASAALENELAGWLRALTPDPVADKASAADASHFAGLSGIRVRLSILGTWHIETRNASDKRWKPPSQKWLTDLARLRPVDFESLVPAEAALASALAAEVRLAPHGLSVKQPLPPAAVNGLLRTTAARPALT